jgi:Xaa-Pro aminopeptidase
MNKQRIQRLQELMRADGVEVAVYATSATLQYLLDDASYFWQRTAYTGGLPLFEDTSYNPHTMNLPDCLLVVPVDDEPVLLLTWERLRDMQHIAVRKDVAFFAELPDMLAPHLSGRRVAIGQACAPFLRAQVKGINPEVAAVDAEKYGDALRVIKDSDEISRLRRAATFTDDAMGRIVEILTPGITSHEVEDAVIGLARDKRLLDLPFMPTARYVATGTPESERIDGHGEDVPLRPGTSIAFDIGYVLDGYCSDYGRSFYSGKAPTAISDAYKALQEAQLRMFDRIKPGVPMDFGFDVAHRVMTEAGLDRYLMKYGDFGLMGHQIGIDVHEHPWVHGDQTVVFEPGMVMCIEPKLWWPGQFFMRVEDMVLVTEDGCEPLTVFDRELFELPA